MCRRSQCQPYILRKCIHFPSVNPFHSITHHIDNQADKEQSEDYAYQYFRCFWLVHAALLPVNISCPIAFSSSRLTVVNIQRGLMNGRQMNSSDPLLLPLIGLPVSERRNDIRPSVMNRTSSTDCSAWLNQPTDESAGTSITTVWSCYLHCSAAFVTHGEISE